MDKTKRKFELISVALEQLKVHPSATNAFLFTKKLKYQIEPENSHMNLLAQKSFSLPVAECREVRIDKYCKQQYSFFANWLNLLIQDYDPNSRVNILLVDRQTKDEINFQAWLYAFSMLNFSINKNSICNSASEFFELCPLPVQSRFFPKERIPLSKSSKSKILQVSRSAFSDSQP